MDWPCSFLYQVHKLCQSSAEQILDVFQPNLMIAIGGGGYVPARILRYVHKEDQGMGSNLPYWFIAFVD